MYGTDKFTECLSDNEEWGAADLAEAIGVSSKQVHRIAQAVGKTKFVLVKIRKTRAFYSFPKKASVTPAPYRVGYRWSINNLYKCGNGFSISGGWIPMRIPHLNEDVDDG